MCLKLCVLASGSSGNCTYVASEKTALLIDAGLSAKRTVQKLAAIHVLPEHIQGICITHEHSDHTAGLGVLQRRHDMSLFANSGTIQGFNQRRKGAELDWTIFESGSAFTIGDLTIEPFSVPHDAYDPVGYIIQCGTSRVGVVTDMGMVTQLIREKLRTCHALVVESNHDERLLQECSRPWNLKKRIAGRQGHLSNKHAAALLTDIAHADLHRVFLAHLSSDCNMHDIALSETTHALRAAGHKHIRVSCCSAEEISEMWSCALPLKE